MTLPITLPTITSATVRLMATDPLLVTVIVLLVVVVCSLAIYGTVITIFYQRNKIIFKQLKKDLNGKCFNYESFGVHNFVQL